MSQYFFTCALLSAILAYQMSIPAGQSVLMPAAAIFFRRLQYSVTSVGFRSCSECFSLNAIILSALLAHVAVLAIRKPPFLRTRGFAPMDMIQSCCVGGPIVGATNATTKNSTLRFGLAENDIVDIFSMSNFL